MGSRDEKDNDQAESSEPRSLLPALLRELRENSTALATFSAEQRNIKEKVQTLTSILKSDDPEKSLHMRLSRIEGEVAGLRKSAEKTEGKIERLSDTSQTFIIEERKDIRESHRQRMQVWIAVITALAGAIVAIITTIWAHK